MSSFLGEVRFLLNPSDADGRREGSMCAAGNLVGVPLWPVGLRGPLVKAWAFAYKWTVCVCSFTDTLLLAHSLHF